MLLRVRERLELVNIGGFHSAGQRKLYFLEATSIHIFSTLKTLSFRDTENQTCNDADKSATWEGFKKGLFEQH